MGHLDGIVKTQNKTKQQNKKQNKKRDKNKNKENHIKNLLKATKKENSTYPNFLFGRKLFSIFSKIL